MTILAIKGGRGQTSRPQDEKGILSLCKNLTFDLPLIGHGDITNDDCGEWNLFKKIGCLDIETHNKTLHPDGHGKIAIRMFKKTCRKPSCPICHPTWVNQAKLVATHKLKHYGHKVDKNPIHVILSPPIEQLKTIKTMNGLFRKAKKICKEYNIPDGSLVYHSKSRKCNSCHKNMPPKKNRCPKCQNFGWYWAFNPHFHFFGFGWLPNWESRTGKQAKDLYKKYGWIVKNLRIRKTIQGTVWYELSHCAFLGPKAHHVRWIGDMTSKNYKPPKMPNFEQKCPICGQLMRPVGYSGPMSEVEKREDIQILEPTGWYYKNDDTFHFNNKA